MQPPARSNRAYRIVAHIVRPLLRAMTRHDWSGTENFPREGGFIVASNHMTNIDPLTFAHYLWDNGVAPKILAKAPLFKVPVLAGVLRATGQIPVYRNTASAGESLTAAVTAIGDGDVRRGVPGGHADPGPGPVADGRQDRHRAPRADHAGRRSSPSPSGARRTCWPATASCSSRSRASW